MLTELALFLPNGEFVAEKQNRTSTLILAAGVLGALIVLATQGPDLQFWKNRISSWIGSAKEQVDITRMVSQPVQENKGNGEETDPSGVPGEDPLALNEMGVSLVLKKKFWEGIHCFEKAIRLDPSGVIPIINMAMVLTDMGLNRPAERYVAMAKTINPDHVWLQRNFGVAGDLEKLGKLAGGMPPNGRDQESGRQVQEDGSWLWDEETLMLWGIDGSELY